jgi:hypothetical protein
VTARASTLAAVLACLVLPAAARADDDRKPIALPSPLPKEAPAPEPTPSPPPDATAPARAEAPKPEDVPYTEGWHAGSPPGEHFSVHLEYWDADMKRGTEFEFDHGGRRVGVLRTTSLGYGATQPVWSGGAELDAGDYGWYSFDYWQVVLSGRTHSIGDGDHIFVDTLFPNGDLVQSRDEQHYARLRDGVDVRYRIPLDEDVAVDLSFGPVLGLALRYESLDVNSIVGPRSDGSHFFALSIVPGTRLGVDLHLPARVTLRAAADVDWLPELPHVNPLSLTREPSIRMWHDVHAYLAARFWFLELDAGYRFFEAYSGKASTPGGGRLRHGNAFLRGFDAGVSVRF